MKQIIIILFTIISSLSAFAVRKYDIVETYEITQAPKDSKAVNAYGVVTNAKYILTPSKIKYGECSVELSKIGENIFKINGTNLCVETKYCSEWISYSKKAILVIESSFGYFKGKLIFE